jgi:hypothetical protein
MPALTDIDLPAITGSTPTGHPPHPSPTRDKLTLERMSPRELGYWGQIFGVDTPYLMVPLGWGEWEALTGG